MPGSQHQSRNFTLSVFQPLPAGGAHLFDLATGAQSYGHSIAAFGGFERANLGIVAPLGILQEWYEDGLGRLLVAYDDMLLPMWEGFVNQVTIRQAGLNLSRGPLVNIANRVSAVYSSVDTSTTPPTVGVRKTTTTVNHLASQSQYGIWPKVLSLAGVTDANADQLRDTHLAEYNRPETNSSYAPNSQDISVIVECLGFASTLTYPYNQTTLSGTTALSTMLQAILAANPNAWLSGDMARIATNTLQVGQWQNDNRLASGLIKGLVAMGDSSSRRHLFGIYEGRQAVYAPMPTEWEYEIRLSDPGQLIRDRAGGEIAPWAVRPGKWLFFSDFLPGRISDNTDLREDPRMLFIETVSYSMPQGLTINGGKVDTLAQKMARLGLAGGSI